MTLLILNHLLALTIALGFFLVAVLAYTAGKQNRTSRPLQHGSTGARIELGYVAEIPIAYLLDAGDAVEVTRWLEAVKEGVGVRV